MHVSGERDAARAAELAARQSYGRLLAYLARTFRDIAAAEDALGDAFAQALRLWPQSGVPENADAWLLVAARNRLLDAARRRKTQVDALAALPAEALHGDAEASPVPDRRLELMFVCAHPAIEAPARTPLMLQTVLGLSAERIAASFLVSPDAMGRRLGRAKSRIRTTGLSFQLPEPEDLPERLANVLEAVYAGYGHGWDSIASGDAARRGLSTEAIWLARVLLAVSPESAEVRGLLALMLFCEARAPARRVDGRYVPLGEQDVTLWDRGMIEEAESHLREAGTFSRPGRFQLEAAIQSASVEQRIAGTDMRTPLVHLHAALVGFAPTVGNALGWAAALADVEGPIAGLGILDTLPADRVANHQPFWALRAHLLARSEEASGAADDAFARAIGLSDDPAIRTYLQERRQRALQ